MTPTRMFLLCLGLTACREGVAPATDTGTETDAGTEPASDATTVADSSTGSGTGTSTGGPVAPEDVLVPWYGEWYWFNDWLYTLNEPMAWGDWGDSFWFRRLELDAERAIFTRESCWDWSGESGPTVVVYEYIPVVLPDGTVDLEPVDGVHRLLSEDTVRMYIPVPSECGTIQLVSVQSDGTEYHFPEMSRGRLCLEYCAVTGDDYGLLSDCGTPVPWACPDDAAP